MAKLIAVIIFAIFCAVMLGIFYMFIKIQERKFEKHMNTLVAEAKIEISKNVRDTIAIALDVSLDALENRGKNNE